MKLLLNQMIVCLNKKLKLGQKKKYDKFKKKKYFFFTPTIMNIYVFLVI